MGFKERADIFLLRNYRILVTLLIFGIFVLSFALPTSALNSIDDLTNEINPTVVNGILTATAVVFGFVAYELREIKSSNMEKFLLAMPLLLFLVITLRIVFDGAVVNKMTLEVALVVTANCIFNIFYTVPIIIVKQSRLEIEQRKIAKQKEKEC